MCKKCNDQTHEDNLVNNIPEEMQVRCPVCDHFVDNPMDLTEADLPGKKGWKVFGHKSCFDACGEDLKPNVVN